MTYFTPILFVGILSLVVGCATYESKVRACAEAGEAEAEYQLASMYWEGRAVHRDHTQALKWIQWAAEHGHREAQIRLAELYERGKGISRDYVQAARMYAMGAERGDPESGIRLAQLYLKGQAVPQSDTEARTLLERAAGKKAAEAQYLLGQLYWEGRGVPKDRVQAHKWFNLAEAQGHERAVTMRLLVAMEMDRDQIVEAQRLAIEQSKAQ